MCYYVCANYSLNGIIVSLVLIQFMVINVLFLSRVFITKRNNKWRSFMFSTSPSTIKQIFTIVYQPFDNTNDLYVVIRFEMLAFMIGNCNNFLFLICMHLIRFYVLHYLFKRAPV